MLLEVRVSPKDAFLYEAASSTVIERVIQQAVVLHNLRLCLAEELTLYSAGIAAEDATRSGEKRKLPETEGACVANDGPLAADAAAAAQILSPASVGRKLVTSQHQLETALQSLRSGPPSTPACALSACGSSFVFAGRLLERDKALSDYFGKNDKSKAVVTLRAEQAATADGAAAASEQAAGCGNSPSDSALEATAGAGVQASTGCGLSGSSAACIGTSDASARQGEAAPDAGQRSASHGATPAVSLSSFFKRARADGEAGGGRRGAVAEGDEDESLLTDAQAAAVRASAAVASALHSRELRRIVRGIDGADSRELALRRLEAALLEGDFHSFTRDVLRSIGHSTAAELEE